LTSQEQFAVWLSEGGQIPSPVLTILSAYSNINVVPLKTPKPGSAEELLTKAKTAVKEHISQRRGRRGRPPTIDVEQVLGVAREIFLSRGIRATTLEVAEQAGISEGSLFHKFRTKEGLFRAAMNMPEGTIPDLVLSAVGDLEGMELKDALMQLAQALLRIGKVGIPLMMMSWSNPDACSAHFDYNRARFREVMKRIAAYLERQMVAGRLRNIDPEVVARTFLGAIHHYCMTRLMAGDDGEGIIPESMFARGLVDLILHGAVAPQPTAKS
jgi:AcrR family transcriptional regulator